MTKTVFMWKIKELKRNKKFVLTKEKCKDNHKKIEFKFKFEFK